MIIGREPFAVGDALEQEMVRAARAMPFLVIDQLAAMGVPRWVLAELCSVGDLGRFRVVETGGRWRPANEGEPGPPRLILAVRDIEFRLIDMVAVSSVDPETWSLRTGDGIILGAERLDLARDAADAMAEAKSWGAHLDPDERREIEAGRHVCVHARPIDLLISGCDGICVLDWRPAALWALRSLGPQVTLMADTAAAAKNLSELLRCGGLPEVVAARRERRAA